MGFVRSTAASLVRNKPRLIIIAALFVATALIMSRPEDARTVVPEKAWRVETLRVDPAPLQPTLELFGAVISPQDAQLSAAIEADVVALNVLDGQTVTAGDVLLQLDGREAELTLAEREAEVLEANAQLRLAQRRLERNRQALQRERQLLEITDSRAKRAEELFEDDLISANDVETTTENLTRQQLAVNQSELTVEENELSIQQLRAQLSRAKAQRDRAQLDLDRTRLTAPFDGVISELATSVGDRVRSGDNLMRLQNPAALEIRAQVPTRFAETIRNGLTEGAIRANIEIDDQTLTGEMVRLSGQTREGSGGVDSFVRIDRPDPNLRLGATVRVLVDLPEVNNAIGVPAEAIYGSNRLFRSIENRMQMIEVERVGERYTADGRTEVLIRSSQLQSGDLIVVTKLANAVDGLLLDTGMGSSADPLADPRSLSADADALSGNGG